MTVLAWLTVLAIAVTAVLFGQGARTPARLPRDIRQARSRRIGTALSISGPFAVIAIALGLATITQAWLITAAVAFAAITVVSLTGLVLAPH